MLFVFKMVLSTSPFSLTRNLLNCKIMKEYNNLIVYLFQIVTYWFLMTACNLHMQKKTIIGEYFEVIAKSIL